MLWCLGDEQMSLRAWLSPNGTSWCARQLAFLALHIAVLAAPPRASCAELGTHVHSELCPAWSGCSAHVGVGKGASQAAGEACQHHGRCTGAKACWVVACVTGGLGAGTSAAASPRSAGRCCCCCHPRHPSVRAARGGDSQLQLYVGTKFGFTGVLAVWSRRCARQMTDFGPMKNG